MKKMHSAPGAAALLSPRATPWVKRKLVPGCAAWLL